jgi:hypothetical protein
MARIDPPDFHYGSLDSIVDAMSFNFHRLRLRSEKSLTPDQMELACILAPDWAASYEELLSTTRTLRP